MTPDADPHASILISTLRSVQQYLARWSSAVVLKIDGLSHLSPLDHGWLECINVHHKNQKREPMLLRVLFAQETNIILSYPERVCP